MKTKKFKNIKWKNKSKKSRQGKMNTKSGMLVSGVALLLICALIGTVEAKTWYVDDDGGPGIDVTRIQEAVDNVTLELQALILGEIHDITVVNDTAYLIAGDSFLTMDVSDPANPVKIGQYNAMGCEDWGYSSGIVVSGSYAYAGWGKGLVIFDVTDLSNPTVVGRYDYNPTEAVSKETKSRSKLSVSDAEKMGIKPFMNQQPNWQIYTGYPGMAAPVFADIDPDYPGLETVVMYPVGFITWDSCVYIWHQDGTTMANWDPKIILGEAVYTGSSAAVGDIDNNGHLDIIITTHAPKVHAFNYDGTPLSGWPKTIGGDITSTPVLADLDNDGYLEVLVSSKGGKLYIWRYDGSNFNPAWPMWTNRTLYRSPAVGNLDDDEDLEIVLGTGSSGLVYNYVYIWNIDGTTLNSNWPKALEYRYRGHTPSLGDIDCDGELEIILGIGLSVDDGKVYAWNLDGSLVSGDWPKLVSGYAFFCPISDIYPDYQGLEIVTSIRYDNKIYAWHCDGSDVLGWPYIMGGEGGNSPAIGDIEGDGSLEVVVGSYDYKVYAIKSNSNNVPGWPKETGYIIQTSPAIGDIDNDDKTEIAQPSADGWVYMWEVAGTGIMSWPMLQHDERHSGLYLKTIPATTVSITTDEFEYFIGDTMTITIDIVNPAEDSITFQWYWGVPQYSIWLPVMSASIPAGYDDTLDYSFTIPNWWGSTPFGNVFYVQLLDADDKVLDADAACWAYTPSGKVTSQIDIAKEIKTTIERIG